MHHEHASVAGLGDEFVHGPGELDHPTGGAATPVVVPHVDDDQGGSLGIPLDGFFD